MRALAMWREGLLLGSLGLVGLGTAGQPPAPKARAPEIKVLMQKDLVSAPGKETLMLTVEYPPGAVEAAHRHRAQAFVYVLEGSVVMQLRGQDPVTLKPGDTFYEGPDDVHVGRNASATSPARFVVFMVKDKGAPPVLPVE